MRPRPGLDVVRDVQVRVLVAEGRERSHLDLTLARLLDDAAAVGEELDQVCKVLGAGDSDAHEFPKQQQARAAAASARACLFFATVYGVWKERTVLPEV